MLKLNQNNHNVGVIMEIGITVGVKAGICHKCGGDSIGVLCYDCYELELSMIIIRRRLSKDKSK